MPPAPANAMAPVNSARLTTSPEGTPPTFARPARRSPQTPASSNVIAITAKTMKANITAIMPFRVSSIIW